MVKPQFESAMESVYCSLAILNFQPWEADPLTWMNEHGDGVEIIESDEFYSPDGAPQLLTSFNSGSMYPNMELWKKLRKATPACILMDDY